jgi:hypothetical protein
VSAGESRTVAVLLDDSDGLTREAPTEQAPRKGADHARRGGRTNTDRDIPVHQPNRGGRPR